jgi:hypothetical protein
VLRKVRPVVHLLALALLAACGGGDGPIAGNSITPKTGSLTVTIADAPIGVAVSVTVAGPNGFARTIAGTTTITGLTPGSYTVSAPDVATESAIYAPRPAAQNVEVMAGNAPAVDVVYALASGSIEVAIVGLPTGGAGAITIMGPNNFSQQISTNATLVKLTPGAYVVTAAAVTVAGDGYAAPAPARSVDISASLAPTVVSVAYAVTTARLLVTASGLPPTATATFQVSGPNAFSQVAALGQVIAGLVPGTYTITSPNVSIGSTTYVPTTINLAITLEASAVPAQATVPYVIGGGGGGGPNQINLTIDALYVTQSVQTYAGDVPLVAGRDGLVRVFVKANTTNTVQPQVRVRLYSGATLLSTLTLNAPASAVPTTPNDATLASAWYAPLAGSLIQPGLKILADVDPSNTVAEGSETDNIWPGSGAAATMNVKSVSTFSVRFVPITQSNSLTGNVTTANTAAFLNDMRRMYPLGTINADVRAPFTTSAAIFQSNDLNGAWSAVLAELNALRISEGSGRYYFGIAKTTYNSGVAGMGYLGTPTALGWDHLPSGADVMAHELGHNWGRYHAPCGGAGSPDPLYPYAGGSIGASGYDLTTSVFKAPSIADLMGYCVPNWVSDYTYKGIISYRETHASVTTAAQTRVAESGLLVWGRVTGTELVLEPAFEIVAPASLPVRGGANHIDGVADDGTLLFSYAFEGDAIDHGSPQDRQFAFVVPMRALRGYTLGTLRLRSGTRVSEARSSSATLRALDDAGAAAPRVRRLAGRTARLSWSETAVRGVLVRDARTGDILAFARGGAAHLEVAGPNVELVVSDGVRSRVRRAAVR